MSTAHVHPGRLPRGPPQPRKERWLIGLHAVFPPPCDATGPLTCPIPATRGRTSHGGFPLRHTRHQMSLHVRMHKHTQHTCALTHTLLSTRQQAESLGWSCRSPSPSPRAPHSLPQLRSVQGALPDPMPLENLSFISLLASLMWSVSVPGTR